MLTRIRVFFTTNFGEVSATDKNDNQIRLASAALLVELMLQDGELMALEKQKLIEILQQQYLLSDDQSDELYELAREASGEATDYHQFTYLIARQFTQPQKITLIENLWRVAYADHHLDKYEENMVRKIADLIHVSHKDFIQAKHRVECAASKGI